MVLPGVSSEVHLNQVLFVVGEPGIGKSTLVRELIQQVAPKRVYRHPKPKWDIHQGLCLAGHYDGGKFDGADTMPISDIWPAVTYWIENLKGTTLTVFDGDKFSNPKVLATLKASAPEHEFRCLLMTDSPEKVQARRDARGTKQNPIWVKGRATKAGRFITHFPGDAGFHLDLNLWAASTLPQLASTVLSWLGHGSR